MAAQRTIYYWMNQQKLSVTPQHLRHQGVRQRRYNDGRRKNNIPLENTIAYRPQEINLRHFSGHFEGDTVVSPRGKDKYCVVTFVDRKTRHLFAVIVPNHDTKNILCAIKKLQASFLKSIPPLSRD